MTELTAWVKSFAAAQRQPSEVAIWAKATADTILARVDSLAQELHPTVLNAVQQHWLAFLDRIAVPDATFELVPAARELTVEIARHHLGLPVLLKIYQVGQEASWDFAVDVVRQAPADVDHEALLVWFWTKATTWFGSSVEQSVALYQEESTRIRQRGDTRRYELIGELLAGRPVGSLELSAALGGYPINATTHVALIAQALSADYIERLEPALNGLARALGGARLVLVRPGGRELWGWLTVSGNLTPRDGGALDPSIVRVTLGGPAEGLEGFVAAHQDARIAQRVALSPGREVALTRYDDVAALTLLAQDHGAAERFTRTTLRGLDDPSSGKLRETARVVLTSPENADAVAEKLGVHKNTVRYRITHAERILGHPLQARAGDLLLALDYYDAFLA